MKELLSYHKLVCLPDWNDTSEHVVEKMEALVHCFVASLLELQNKDKNFNGRDFFSMTSHDWANVWGSFLLLSYSKTFCEHFGQEKIVFERLAQDAHHWSGLNCFSCRCSLSNAYNSENLYCGSCDIVYAESLVKPSKDFCPNRCGYKLNAKLCCKYCSKTYKYLTKEVSFAPKYNGCGQLLPFETGPSGKKLRITVPKHFSDTSHVAHIVWKYCGFLESLERKQQQTEAVSVHSKESIEGL